jgi:hypothetical protein
MNQSFGKRFILAFALCGLVSPAQAGTQGRKLSGFQLTSCGVQQCISIEAPVAYMSMAGSSYSVPDAQVTLTDKHAKKPKGIHAGDLYFDHFTNKVYLRNLASASNGASKMDAIYDLSSEQLTLFAKD